MATVRKKIRFLDLDMRFLPHPVTGDVTILKDEKAVIASIGNLIQTNFYERLFNHKLGCRIRRLLFEPIDSITAIQIAESIELVLTKYEPRVTIKNVIATANEDLNRYDIAVTITINNLTDPFTINFFLERIR